MLNKDDFISRGQIPTVVDEDTIDIILEGMKINEIPVTELFYCSEFYDDVAIDYGGGVYGITCRDVLSVCNADVAILREQLGLRNTKQNNRYCEEIIRLCDDSVKRGGYGF